MNDLLRMYMIALACFVLLFNCAMNDAVNPHKRAWAAVEPRFTAVNKP